MIIVYERVASATKNACITHDEKSRGNITIITDVYIEILEYPRVF